MPPAGLLFIALCALRREAFLLKALGTFARRFLSRRAALRSVLALLCCLAGGVAAETQLLPQQSASEAVTAADQAALDQQSQPAAHPEPSEADIFARGCDLLLHAGYDPATQVFDDGVERYPRSSRLQLGLGVALYSRGVYDQAVDAFMKASDLDPMAPRPYQFLGKTYDLAPDRAAAVTERLHRFAQAAPNSAQAQYDYAMSLWKARIGSTGGAPLSQVQPLLERALTLDPKFPGAHLQLGILLDGQREYQKAVDQYRQALELDPGLAEAHQRLGQALARLGQESEANREIQIYQRLHEQQPAEADRQRQQVRQFVLAMQAPAGAAPSGKSTNTSSDAGIEFSDSAGLKPGGVSGSVDAGGYSSQTQARGSELRQALGELGTASKGPALAGGGADTGAESSSFERARGLLLGGDFSRAADAFRQGAERFPESARMMLGLGVADYSRGLYLQAIDTLCKAVDIGPDEPQAYFFLAQAYAASPAETDRALKLLARYAASHPGNAPAQYYYALCLWRSRIAGQTPADPGQVEQLLSSAIALDPSLAEAHFELGAVLANQNQPQQAASEFERAVALDPQWAEAHYRLGQAYRQAGKLDKAQTEFDESERLRKSGYTEDRRLSAEIRRLLGA